MNSKATIIWFIKIALSVAFLSAVADRFGLWGQPGMEGVAWGNFENFIAYTELLNPLMPKMIIPTLAWGVTILEIILGVLLLTNFFQKEVALVSGGLILIFGLSMVFFLSFKAPLDYSVFSASAAAFGLYALLNNQSEVTK